MRNGESIGGKLKANNQISPNSMGKQGTKGVGHQREKKCESSSPCLRPLDAQKNPLKVPPSKIENHEYFTQPIVQLIHLDSKLFFVKTHSRNPQSTLLETFSRSILQTRLDELEIIQESTDSFVISISSMICLPLMKAL